MDKSFHTKSRKQMKLHPPICQTWVLLAAHSAHRKWQTCLVLLR